MAVTVEWTNRGCILCKIQVTSSLTISTLAHRLKYKQQLIAWEIGYFTEKKTTLLSLSLCTWEPGLWSAAEAVPLSGEASLTRKGSNSVQGYVRRGGKAEILWTNPVNAGFNCCWKTPDLFSFFFFFLAKSFFFSSISGQSSTTDLFRCFSVKSVRSPFPFLDRRFLLPSSICCWHLLWHNTSGSESLAEGLRAGTVRGQFCLLAEERKVGSAIGNPIPWAPPSDSRQEVRSLLSVIAKSVLPHLICIVSMQILRF